MREREGYRRGTGGEGRGGRRDSSGSGQRGVRRTKKRKERGLGGGGRLWADRLGGRDLERRVEHEGVV